jgi:hypothetical protein
LRGEEVAKYLLLAGKLRRHELTLNPEQQVGMAPALGTGRAGSADPGAPGRSGQRDRTESHALREQIEAVIAAREQSCHG